MKYSYGFHVISSNWLKFHQHSDKGLDERLFNYILVLFHSKLKWYAQHINHNFIAETLEVNWIKSHLSAEKLEEQNIIPSTGICFFISNS